MQYSRALVWLGVLLVASLLPVSFPPPSTAIAQSASNRPQPGDVFREYAFPQRLTLCFRPSRPESCNNIPSERSAGLTFNPAGAVRAELAVEYWGGHIGTRQHFRVNSQDYW